MFLSFQRSDEPEESDELVKSTEEESVNGKKKGKSENGKVNGKTEEQPSKKRKQDSSSPQPDAKKPSPEKRKVREFDCCIG